MTGVQTCALPISYNSPEELEADFESFYNYHQSDGLCRELFNAPETARAFKIHNLEELITLAGLYTQFNERVNTNIQFGNNWSFIKTTINWSEQLRYQMGRNQVETQMMLLALTDPKNGILPWIKKHW